MDKSREVHIDHDHVTGQVRKILCRSCNGALGKVKENINTLQNMIEYLNYYKDVDPSETSTTTDLYMRSYYLDPYAYTTTCVPN